MTPQEIISDEEIARVHGHANFGPQTTPREVVNEGVLKYAFGYHSGHTQLCILMAHGLITKPRPGSYDASLTKKGKRYARATGAYHAITSTAPAVTPAPVAETAGEAVAWFRQSAQNPSAWYQVDAEERKYYERQGQRILPLLDSSVPAQDDDKLRIAVEALEDARNRLPEWFECLSADDRSPAMKRILDQEIADIDQALAALKTTAAQEGGSK